MKRITIEEEEDFVDEFSKYCIENKTSKKALISKLIREEMKNEGKMKQYETLNINNQMIPFINEKNYYRLFELPIEDEEAWIFRDNLMVNKVINTCFKEDEILSDMIFTAMDNGVKEFEIPHGLLDHDYYVKFSDDNIDYNFEESLYGIMTFPYQNFNFLKEIIDTWDTKFWNIYVINPVLMRYASGSLGLFITPKDNYLILDINGYIKSLTGYKLFYNWTDKDIKPIMEDKHLMPDSFWVERLINDYAPIMCEKIIKFWLNNKEDVECGELEHSYFSYKHHMPFTITDVLLTTLKGPIELVDTKTGWTTGVCRRLGFDIKSFKCVYVDRKIANFTEEQLEDFKNGDFELKLHK